VSLGLALTEGIEDALAVLNSGFAPVWACLSAGTMASFPVLGGIEALTVFADNDSAGAQAAAACVERWRAAGKEARVVAPPGQFKDFGAVAEARHG
jgi:putative DNA primase/helicase